MITGIGVDIVEVARVARAIDRWGDRFAERILSQGEVEAFADKTRNASFLSRQFAAKEAVSKALGTGMKSGVHFSGISVLRDLQGRPFIQLSEQVQCMAQERCSENFHISLSGESEYAIACVIAES